MKINKLSLLFLTVFIILFNCNDKPNESILNGDFITPPEPVYLSIASVKCNIKTNLKIKFHQSIDKTSIKTIEQFSIKDSSNNPLKISKVTMDQDTNKILYLETDIQKERENYSITITNLKGLNNEITHENGLITEFTGFIPANEKRFFQIITPNEITVNRTFNVTINAIKGSDNSFVTDYNEEISFEVVGSSGYFNS